MRFKRISGYPVVIDEGERAVYVHMFRCTSLGSQKFWGLNKNVLKEAVQRGFKIRVLYYYDFGLAREIDPLKWLDESESANLQSKRGGITLHLIPIDSTLFSTVTIPPEKSVELRKLFRGGGEA